MLFRSLNTLTVEHGGECTVVFGTTATVNGNFTNFVAKDGSALVAKDLVGSSFTWDGTNFVMTASGAYYNTNRSTVAAATDNSSALYV